MNLVEKLKLNTIPIIGISIFLAITLYAHQSLINVYYHINGVYMYILYTFMVIFLLLTWLLGGHYIAITLLSTFRYFFYKTQTAHLMTQDIISANAEPIAILYLTCNDFDAKSLASCAEQDWPNSVVYVLDDSSEDSSIAEVDIAIAGHYSNVKLIRRSNKLGAKAGNINHGIEFISENYVIICDADQILPSSFVRKILPKIQQSPRIGYVQGLHKARKDQVSIFSSLLNDGIFLFWCILLPIRERYGFPMFLGHGGIIRTELIKTIGFPHVVAEDLAFSVNAYENGFLGRYAEDVISYEAFPKNIRDYRKRHMKWVRGTLEFLKYYTFTILRSKNLTKTQMWDIFMGLIQVSLGYWFILFSIAVMASYILPVYLIGDLSAVNCSNAMLYNCFGLELKIISSLMILAPFFPFGIPLLLMGRPIKFVIFYIFGVAIYVASIPITFLGMTGFFKDGAADFITTGDNTSDKKLVGIFRNPNHYTMILGELFFGICFLLYGMLTDSIGTIGIGITFLVFPLLLKFDLTKYTIPLAIVGPIMCLLDFPYK